MTKVPSRAPCRRQARMDRNPFGMHKRQRGRRTGPSLVVSLSGPCQARLLSGGRSCSSWSSKTNSTSCSKTSSSWSSTRSSSWNWSSSSTSCWMSCLRQAGDARQSSPLPAYRAWPLGPGHPARRPSPALRWRALSLSSSSSCHSPVGQDRLWDGQQENALATDLFRRLSPDHGVPEAWLERRASNPSGGYAVWWRFPGSGVLLHSSTGKNGWGARIRTWEWRYQKPLPYRLATPHRGAGVSCHAGRMQQAIGLTHQSGKVACVVALAWLAGAARFASCAGSAPALYAPIRSKPVMAERASARCRSVAQPGRALRSGRRGRRFKSCHSDHLPAFFELLIVDLWRIWHQAAKPFATT